jgi:protein SCO1/2
MPWQEREKSVLLAMKRNTSTCFLLAFFLVSCSGHKNEQTDLVTFPLRGEVVAVDTIKLRVTIAHEEIPDFMAEMTMPFKVKDPNLLRSISPGDTVAGTLAVSRTESWLATLTVVGSGTPPDVLDAEGVNLARLLKPGDRLPDLAFLNQEGRTVHFSDFRGKVLAVTFIYTRCPLPEFCIRMSDNFSKIQTAMKKKGRTGWHLITVSFDPVYDRPPAMKSYGMSYGADFANWDFLTDPDTTGRAVLALAEGFDLTYEDDEGALIAHNLRTALIDAEGKLVEIVKDNEWKPEEIAAKIGDLLGQED